MNYFWNELEMKRGVELFVIWRTCLPTLKWKDPEAVGGRAPPRPTTLDSSFRVYKEADRAQTAKFGCVFIFVQPQIPAKN